MTEERTLADVEKGLDMPLQEAMLTQRAIRRLKPDPVDDAIVLRCIELALKAPTGSNGQNWEFVVVKDRERKAALARRNRQSWSIYGGIGRMQNRDNEPMQRILDAVQWQAEHFEDIPVIVVPCLRGNRVPFMPMPPFANSSYYGSIYPSVQNLLLAARAMGLGAALITLPLWSTTAASCPWAGPRAATAPRRASRWARSPTSTGTGTNPGGIEHFRPYSLGRCSTITSTSGPTARPRRSRRSTSWPRTAIRPGAPASARSR